MRQGKKIGEMATLISPQDLLYIVHWALVGKIDTKKPWEPENKKVLEHKSFRLHTGTFLQHVYWATTLYKARAK